MFDKEVEAFLIDNNQYCLEMISGTAPGTFFSLANGINTLGRHSANSVCLSAEGLVISKKHALLTVDPDRITIEDCDSINGLFVNGIKVGKADITEGDIIGFGENGPRLRFIATSEIRSRSLSVQATIETPLHGKSPATDVMTEDTEDSPFRQMSSEAIPLKSQVSPAVPEDAETKNTPLEKQKTALPAAAQHEDNGWDDIPLPLPGGKKQAAPDHAIQQDVFTTREVENFMMGKRSGNRGGPRNSVSATQEVLFSKFRKVYKKRSRTTHIIAGTIIVLLCIVAGYYAAGYYRYWKMFSESMSVREEAKKADGEYERIRAAANIDENEKQRLLGLLENRERKLDSLMELLPGRYRQRFFSDPVESSLHEIMVSFKEPYYRMPSHMIGKVKYYVEKFTGDYQRNRALVSKWRNGFFPYIEMVFKEHHIPTVLAYIAMQESLLDTFALSNKGARGLWQFIPETGRQYGLIIDNRTDERTEWKKSTVAAARYLHDLLAEFGEGKAVLLAIAAYNTGGGNVRRALRQIKDPLHDRDFWHLYRTSNILADETREYVPQVLARMIVDRQSALER